MPADLTAYPTGAELLARLQSTGLIADPPEDALALIDYDLKMQGAVERWERATGYVPFLAEGSASTTTYNLWDVLNSKLTLRGGMLSVSQIVIDGTTLELGTHYTLYPGNALSERRPYRQIQFLYPAFVYLGYRATYGADAIAITGIRGYGTTLPANVYDVLLDKGCSLCVPEIALSISGGRTDIRAGKVALGFVRASGGRGASGGPLSGEKQMWDANWKEAVKNFKRL